MPTYQYLCPHCGHEFEEFQSIVDDPVAECPRCGKKPRRLITGGAGFILKGSGFYSTDYRSDAYRRAARADSQPGGYTKEKKDSSGGSASKKAEKPTTSGG